MGVPAVGTKQSDALLGQSTERSAELAISAVSMAARAEVESAHIMAAKFPRNEEVARVKILEACKNPTFAKKAKYKKPVGKKRLVQGTDKWEDDPAVGLSIRFAEESGRHWGNIMAKETMLYEDTDRRIFNIMVKDLQSNLIYSIDVPMAKTVERHKGKNRKIVDERTNSYGDKVFIVAATEDEAGVKQAAIRSKQFREGILRCIPQHVKDEAMAIIDSVVLKKITEDPETERRQLLDGFGKFKIYADQIDAFLGFPLAQANPEKLSELREMLTTIEDGHATWADYADREEAEQENGNAGEHRKQTLSDLQGKMKAAQKAAAPSGHPTEKPASVAPSATEQPAIPPPPTAPTAQANPSPSQPAPGPQPDWTTERVMAHYRNLIQTESSISKITKAFNEASDDDRLGREQLEGLRLDMKARMEAMGGKGPKK